MVSAFARVSSLPIPDPDPEPDSWEAFTDHSPRAASAGAPLDDDEEDREGAATGGWAGRCGSGRRWCSRGHRCVLTVLFQVLFCLRFAGQCICGQCITRAIRNSACLRSSSFQNLMKERYTTRQNCTWHACTSVQVLTTTRTPCMHSAHHRKDAPLQILNSLDAHGAVSPKTHRRMRRLGALSCAGPRARGARRQQWRQQRAGGGGVGGAMARGARALGAHSDPRCARCGMSGDELVLIMCAVCLQLHQVLAIACALPWLLTR